MLQKLVLFALALIFLSSCGSTPTVQGAKTSSSQTTLIKDLVIVAKTARAPYVKGGRGFAGRQPKKKKNVEYNLSGVFSNFVSALIIDGKEVRPNHKGAFRAIITLDDLDEKSISAKIRHKDGSITPITFDIRYSEYDPETIVINLRETSYYAIVIGINNYEKIDKLKTPINDVKAISHILTNQYGFKVKLLINEEATRKNISDEISLMSKKLTKGDALLIYYAGHGVSDNGSGIYYWQPVDADPTSESSWLMTDYISGKLRGSKSNNILIISDSCYAGAWTEYKGTVKRDAHASYDLMLKTAHENRSRVLITSGGNEPVEDGTGQRSIFAKSLVLALKTGVAKNAFTAEHLFSQIREPITQGTSSHQKPSYRPLYNASHEAGDFVFVKR